MSKDFVNIHIYPSSFKNESRIEKEAESIEKLSIFSEIFLVGTAGNGVPSSRRLSDKVSIHLLGIENRNAGIGYKIITFLSWYLSVIKFVLPKKVKCINAHSLSSLPLAVFIKFIKNCNLIYDTHELETETNSLAGYRQSIAKLVEKLFIKYVDHIIVVSESIGIWYKKNYKIIHPTVVLNVPKLSKQERFNLFRQRFAIRANQLIMIYQGDLSYGRGVEILLNAFLSRKDDDVVIVFMGDGQLKQKIVDESKSCKNIFYHEFVDTKVVFKYSSSADIGISLIENTCLSYYYCLPNKLFEYAMSGLPVIVSKVFEMEKLVLASDMGLVTEINESSFNSAVDTIIKKDLDFYGKNARETAEKNSWEIQELKLHGVYKSIFD